MKQVATKKVKDENNKPSPAKKVKLHDEEKEVIELDDDKVEIPKDDALAVKRALPKILGAAELTELFEILAMNPETLQCIPRNSRPDGKRWLSHREQLAVKRTDDQFTFTVDEEREMDQRRGSSEKRRARISS